MPPARPAAPRGGGWWKSRKLARGAARLGAARPGARLPLTPHPERPLSRPAPPPRPPARATPERPRRPRRPRASPLRAAPPRRDPAASRSAAERTAHRNGTGRSRQPPGPPRRLPERGARRRRRNAGGTAGDAAAKQHRPPGPAPAHGGGAPGRPGERSPRPAAAGRPDRPADYSTRSAPRRAPGPAPPAHGCYGNAAPRRAAAAEPPSPARGPRPLGVHSRSSGRRDSAPGRLQRATGTERSHWDGAKRSPAQGTHSTPLIDWKSPNQNVPTTLPYSYTYFLITLTVPVTHWGTYAQQLIADGEINAKSSFVTTSQHEFISPCPADYGRSEALPAAAGYFTACLA